MCEHRLGIRPCQVPVSEGKGGVGVVKGLTRLSLVVSNNI